MLLRTRVAAAIATLAVALSAQATAEAHEKGEHAGRKDKSERDKDKDKEKGDKDKEKGDKDEHREGQGGGPPGLSAKDDERHKRLLERFEERRKNRGERAKSEREELRRKLGASLQNQGVQQELRRHAEAVARLERIKEIADADGKTDVSARATAVLAKENARHEKRLATLTGSAAPAASGGAP